MAKIQIKNSFITSSAQITISSSLVRFESAVRAKSFTGSFSGSVANIAGTTNYIPKFTGTTSIGNSAIYQDGSNIGIGTTTAGSTLHAYATSVPQLQLQNSERTFLLTNNTTDDLLSFYYNSANRLQFDLTDQWFNTGNVGIGTTTVSGKLHIQNNANGGTTAILRNADTGTNQYTELKIGYSDSQELRLGSAYNYVNSQWNQSWIYAVARNLALKTESGYAIRFYTGGTTDAYERARIDTNGNLGIGTTSPSVKLHVSASASTTSAVFQGLGVGIGTTVPTNFLNSNTTYFRPSGSAQFLTTYSSNSEAVINLITSGSGDGFPVGGVYFTRQRGQGDAHYQIAAIKALQDGTSTSLAGGKLYFYTKVDGAGTPFTLPAMVIKSDSNVGIGTTAPIARLTVAGSGTGLMLVGNSGFGGNFTAITLNNGTATTSYNLLSSPTDTTLYVNRPSGGNINFREANSDQMTLLSGGNLGIGTTSPSGKLEVVGQVNIYSGANYSTHFYIGGNNYITTANNGITYFRGSSNNIYAMLVSGSGYVQTNYTTVLASISGNVGIGTSSPIAKLDIAGTVRLGSSTSNVHQVTGSLNIGGSTYNNSLSIDKFEYFTLQPYIEGGNFPSNVLSTVGGTAPTFTTMTGSVCPFGKVAYNPTSYESIGEYIPVNPGEILYGEIWAYRSSGASGTAGQFYCGVSRYDKNKNPIAVNLALDYFIASGVTVPSTSTWTKYSGTITMPTTHTPYNGSDGGPVRYVRPYIIVNYNGGTIPTYWGGLKIRKQQLTRDTGVITISGSLGIGTSSPSAKLQVIGTTLSTTLTDGSVSINGGDLLFANDGGGNGFQFDYYNTKMYIGNNAGSTWYMVVQDDGNVGIGTTSPSQLVEAYKSSNGDVVYQITNPNSGTSATAQYFASNGTTKTQFFHTGTSYTGLGVTNYAGLGGIYNGSTGISLAAGGASGIILFGTGTSQSERMRITAAGYVGIGTSNTTPYSSLFPGQLVIDSGTGNVDGIFASTNNTNAAELILTKKNTTNNFGSFLIQHAGTSGDAIAVNYSVNTSTGDGGTNSFKVTTDGTGYFKGSVGIGTTVPTAKLNISGSNSSKLLIVQSPTATSALLVSGSGNVGIGTSIPTSRLNVYTSGSNLSVLKTDGGSGTLFNVTDTMSGSIFSVNDVSGLPVLDVWSDDRVFAGKYNAYDFVISGSRVGIGTNRPLGKLQVTSSTSVPSALFMGGNVGIGTSSPSTKLQIGGTAASGGASGDLGAFLSRGVTTNFFEAFDGTKSFIGGVDNTQTFAKVGTLTNHPVAIVQSNGSAIYIDTSKNVGIGTTSPTQKLEVNTGTVTAGLGARLGEARVGSWVGSGDYAAFAHNTVAGTSNSYALLQYSLGITYLNAASGQNLYFRIGNVDAMMIDSNRNVGIGTTTVRRTLDVSGSFRATGLTSSVAIATQMDKDIPTVDALGTFRRRTYITASAKTTNWLLTNTEEGYYLRSTSATNISCSIRTNATHPIPTNAVYTIFQVGAGTVTVTGSGVVINGSRTTAGQYKALQIIKVGTNTYDVIGGA